MRRRDFIKGIAGSAVARPLAHAQQSANPHRIGYLHGGTEGGDRGFLDEFKAGLRDLGHIEGHDFVLDTRFADGHFEPFGTKADIATALSDIRFSGVKQTSAGHASMSAFDPSGHV